MLKLNCKTKHQKGVIKLFKNKLIKNNKTHHCRKHTKFYKIYKRENNSNVVILSKEDIPEKTFAEISKTVESDLHIGDFNYKGRTILQIQLLADLENKNRITLIRVKKRAIVIIR